jgi:hypothetical protein
MVEQKTTKVSVDDIVESALAGAMRALDARGVKKAELSRTGVYGSVHIICGIPPFLDIPINLPSSVARSQQGDPSE